MVVWGFPCESRSLPGIYTGPRCSSLRRGSFMRGICRPRPGSGHCHPHSASAACGAASLQSGVASRRLDLRAHWHATRSLPGIYTGPRCSSLRRGSFMRGICRPRPGSGHCHPHSASAACGAASLQSGVASRRLDLRAHWHAARSLPGIYTGPRCSFLRRGSFMRGICRPPPGVQRGRSEAPVRKVSTACAHWRPSSMAQTTSDCPRRMSPALNTFSTELR